LEWDWGDRFSWWRGDRFLVEMVLGAIVVVLFVEMRSLFG